MNAEESFRQRVLDWRAKGYGLFTARKKVIVEDLYAQLDRAETVEDLKALLRELMGQVL